MSSDRLCAARTYYICSNTQCTQCCVAFDLHLRVPACAKYSYVRYVAKIPEHAMYDSQPSRRKDFLLATAHSWTFSAAVSTLCPASTCVHRTWKQGFGINLAEAPQRFLDTPYSPGGGTCPRTKVAKLATYCESSSDEISSLPNISVMRSW